MRMVRGIVVALTILPWGSIGGALAAEDAGTRSPFANGTGARALALGGAFAAIATDAAGLTWNPAGLALASRFGYEVAHSASVELSSHDSYAALVAPSWRWGSLGVGVRSVGVGSVEPRDERNVVTGDDFSSSDTEITVGYARALNDAWSLGGSLKLQSQDVGGYGASALAGDLGVLVSVGGAMGVPWLQELTAGMGIRNALEPALRLDRESVHDPRTWRGGLSWRGWLGSQPLTLAVDADASKSVAARMHAGAELLVRGLLAVRVGFNNDRVTAGAGLAWRSLEFGYAFENVALGSVHRLGLSQAFGPTVSASRVAARDAAEREFQNRLESEFDRRGAERLDDLLVRAESAIDQRAYEEALDLVATASILDSADHRVRMLSVRGNVGLGRQMELTADLSSAGDAYGRALAIAPNDTAAIAGAARVRAAGERQAVRDADRGARFRASLDALIAGDWTRARNGFAALARTNPKDVESAAMLQRCEGLIARSTQETERQAAHDRAVASPPPESAASRSVSAASRREAEQLVKRGVAAMSAGRADDAMRYWELALSTDPSDPTAGRYLNREYLARGMDAYAAGRLDAAVGFWEKAQRVDPSDSRAQRFLARAHERREKTRELFEGQR
jgi:tetratricopeptide (TPR) repeat protein